MSKGEICVNCGKPAVVPAKAGDMSFYTMDGKEEYVEYVDPDSAQFFLDVCLECGWANQAWAEETLLRNPITAVQEES